MVTSWSTLILNLSHEATLAWMTFSKMRFFNQCFFFKNSNIARLRSQCLMVTCSRPLPLLLITTWLPRFAHEQLTSFCFFFRISRAVISMPVISFKFTKQPKTWLLILRTSHHIISLDGLRWSKGLRPSPRGLWGRQEGCKCCTLGMFSQLSCMSTPMATILLSYPEK